MSAIGPVIRSTEQKNHARRMGISMVVLGTFVAVFFTRSPGDAGFILSPAFTVLIPSQQFAQVVAIALVGAGALNDAQNQARINITVNGAIDPESTARQIVGILNDSTYRGTNGASNLVGI